MCLGRGIVEPNFYNLLGVSSTVEIDICRSCNNGILWENDCVENENENEDYSEIVNDTGVDVDELSVKEEKDFFDWQVIIVNEQKESKETIYNRKRLDEDMSHFNKEKRDFWWDDMKSKQYTKTTKFEE